MVKLKNVTLDDYRLFLKKAGCKHIKTSGGHEKWVRRDLTRPIIVQTHESPVPEFIIMNALRNLGLKRKDFFNILFDIDPKDNPLTEEDLAEGIQDDDSLCYCGSGRKYKDCHGKRT
ncbi:SEC-C motif [Bacteroidales bacterium Barb6XT]|nr:SEC-C motif [Bacteroidales bacterium Barb6XT]